MDKITENFMLEFKKSNELNIKENDILFEHFSNYCVIYKEYGTDDFDMLDIATGKGTQGIDGLAIIVNGRLVSTINEIQMLINYNKFLNVKFILIQSKTSEEFNNKEIGNFTNYSTVFFKGDNSIFKTDEMKRSIELKDYIFENSKYMKDKNPELILYYVSTGTWLNDESIKAIIEDTKNELIDTNLFSKIEFVPCGSKEIQNLYRKTQSEMSATFKFEKRVTIPTESDNEVGYYGILPFKEFIKIITTDNDNLMPVFEDNIRDFLGENNDVNASIEETIKGFDKSSFTMLNNGITVVADTASYNGDNITINNYQIVNGCQTSHTLYNCRNLEDIEKIMIPFKVIVTKDEDLKNNITKATNNQTAIKKEQLEALSTFQKNLEEYYKTFKNDNEQLYYERRTGQYKNTDVPKSKIVNIPTQIKSVTAMFLNNPHGVSGQYGTIVRKYGTNIFKTSDKYIIYYTSALALYRIESLFKNGTLNNNFRRCRYHALMLFRVNFSSEKDPEFNSKKMETLCKTLLEVLNDEHKCKNTFKSIVDFINDEININEQLEYDDRKLFEKKETTSFLLKQFKDKEIKFT